MSQDQDTAWAELEARAQRLLDHAKEIEPREIVRRYSSVLRLWHYPAFAPHATWTILQPGRKSPPEAPSLVREVVWDNVSDWRWIYAPGAEIGKGIINRPNIRLREAALPKDELDQIVRTGAELSVPLIGFPKSLGLDGEFWGLETYDFSPYIRLQWFCEGPPQWRHFTDWVAALRLFLVRCLDQAG